MSKVQTPVRHINCPRRGKPLTVNSVWLGDEKSSIKSTRTHTRTEADDDPGSCKHNPRSPASFFVLTGAVHDQQPCRFRPQYRVDLGQISLFIPEIFLVGILVKSINENYSKIKPRLLLIWFPLEFVWSIDRE